MVGVAVERRGDLVPRPFAGRLGHVDLVVAALVGVKRDSRPVGRKLREALAAAWRARQVPRRAAVVGRGQVDVAARLENGRLAVVRYRHRVDVVARVDGAIRQRVAVAWHLDVDPAHLVRRRVEHVQPAGLHEHDRPAVGFRHLHVEVGEIRDLLHLLRHEVVREQVGDAALRPVGDEIQQVSDPHRVGVLADIVGDRCVGLRGEVVQPDIRVLAALVALPVVFLVSAAVVGQLRAVGRPGAQDAAVHGHRLGEAAVGRNRVELHDWPERVLVPRPEDDPRAVGRPAHRLQAGAHVGDPRRRAARCGDHVQVRAFVLAREDDVLAVRRELRHVLAAGVACQPRRHATARGHRPEVVFPVEDDGVARDVGVLDEPAGRPRERGSSRTGERERYEHEQGLSHGALRDGSHRGGPESTSAPTGQATGPRAR